MEEEENLGTRQFGEALGGAGVPSGPLASYTGLAELSGDESGAWDGQSVPEADRPAPVHPPGSSSPRPVGYSRESLLANQGNAFYFQLRNSHHNLGSC